MKLVILLSLLSFTVGSTERDGKLFSLFSVVQFKNEPCRSDQDVTSVKGLSDYRNGTCFTSTECTDKGGRASGNCAAGFGVCCYFYKDECGETSTGNQTYFQNPGFPQSYDEDSTSCDLKIETEKDDICFIRLDFYQFSITGPDMTVGATPASWGNCATESFYVTGQAIDDTSAHNNVRICGENSGQHMYLELDEGDSVTLKFEGLSKASSAKWDIMASQIECSKSYGPPRGCLQYHTGNSGSFQTFNFGTDSTHINSHDYSICIRQEQGNCCIKYSVCNVPNPFSLDSNVAPDPAAAHDDGCPTGTTASPGKDYVSIIGSSYTCQSNNLVNRYCGGVFNPFTTATENAVVCDCSAPFIVGIHTNDVEDATNEAASGKINSGVCLNYVQVPCGAINN